MNADLSASSLVARMTPGKAHTMTDLGKLFGCSAKGVTPTLTAAIHAGLIVGVKIGDGYKISTRYYVAGTEPKKAEEKAPQLHRWQIVELTGYDRGNREFQELARIGRGAR
jgi:hypothetical protein